MKLRNPPNLNSIIAGTVRPIAGWTTVENQSQLHFGNGADKLIALIFKNAGLASVSEQLCFSSISLAVISVRGHTYTSSGSLFYFYSTHYTSLFYSG
jgi:hypothetical protein